MPRFFFHVVDNLDSPDDEGSNLVDARAARAHASHAARNLMCETLMREGRITLHHRIDIEDKDHHQIASVAFRDAVRVEDEG